MSKTHWCKIEVGQKGIFSRKIFCLLFLLVSQSGCVYYILDQARGQMEILAHRRPLAEVLQSPHLTKKNRQKILLVQRARIFSAQTLSLPSESYQFYFDTHNKAVAYNVSACPPLKFHPVTWSFPLVGSVPYLGFFHKDQALAMKYKLKKRGLDVVLREVAAYSTLGWFQDPLFSKLLDNREDQLAETVIHEIAHQHIYIAGQADFNENVATIIGEEGAKLFLQNFYGGQSYVYKAYLRLLVDRKIFQEFMMDLYQKLEALYKGPLAKQKKLLQKKSWILQAKKDFAKLPFITERYRGVSLVEWNNAFLLSLVRYRGHQKTLKRLFKKIGDFKKFILYLEKVSKGGKPWKEIRKALAG